MLKSNSKKLTRSGSLADRIKRALDQEKISLKANQQLVAEHFHISARTLNRHLQKENTSLKQIVTECRIEKAKVLLKGNMSIEQIAQKLGLSGRRTLDRIFIKHTNSSPAQYRAKAYGSQQQEVNQQTPHSSVRMAFA